MNILWMILLGGIYAWFTVVAMWWMFVLKMSFMNRPEIANSEFFSMIFNLLTLAWIGISLGLGIFYSWKLVLAVYVGSIVLRVIPVVYGFIEDSALLPFSWLANSIMRWGDKNK